MDSDPRQTPLQTLQSVAGIADDMGAVVTGLVAQARLGNHSWAEIGQALGITRQAAHARYGRHIPRREEDVQTSE